MYSEESILDKVLSWFNEDVEDSLKLRHIEQRNDLKHKMFNDIDDLNDFLIDNQILEIHDITRVNSNCQNIQFKLIYNIED